MIAEFNGRWRSFPAKEEAAENRQEEIVVQNPRQEDLDLDRFARQLFERAARGDADALDYLRAAEDRCYLEPPVDIKTFINDPGYMGCLGGNLFPVLAEDLNKLSSGKYQTVVLTGGAAWGKTTVSLAGLAYQLYRLSCLRDPQSSMGVIPGSSLDLVVAGGRPEQTKIILRQLEYMIKPSPYFRDRFPSRKKSDGFAFPRNINVTAVKGPGSLHGLNLAFALLDQANLISGRAGGDYRGISYGGQNSLYAAVHYQMKIRLQAPALVPPMIILNDSKHSPDDFTEKLLKANCDNPKLFARDHSIYEVNPDRYQAEGFIRILVGRGGVESRLVGRAEQPTPEEEKSGCWVEDFPRRLARELGDDIDTALCKIAGILPESKAGLKSRKGKPQAGMRRAG